MYFDTTLADSEAVTRRKMQSSIGLLTSSWKDNFGPVIFLRPFLPISQNKIND